MYQPGDYCPEKIGFKIREAQIEKIRHRSEGDQGAVTGAELVQRLQRQVAEKRL